MPTHGPAETHGAAAEGGGIAERLRDLAHLPRDIAFARLGYGLKRPVFSLPIYRYSLGGVSATVLEVVPTDPWPGNAEHGAEIAGGAFTLTGQRMDQPSPRWSPAGAGPEWLAELHGFAWLRDLRAGSGDNARRAARELTGDWLDRHGAWTAPAWDPLITGRRLANWLGCYEFFAASADLHFRHHLLDGIAHQARHLSRVLPAGLAHPRDVVVQQLVPVGRREPLELEVRPVDQHLSQAADLGPDEEIRHSALPLDLGNHRRKYRPNRDNGIGSGVVSGAPGC